LLSYSEDDFITAEYKKAGVRGEMYALSMMHRKPVKVLK
jgi:hypothetical protein